MPLSERSLGPVSLLLTEGTVYATVITPVADRAHQ